MILYRIAKCIYADDMSGTGARLYGGRWNSAGRSAIYMASSRSLAVLEVLVHLPPMLLPDNYCLAQIEVPEKSIKAIDSYTLPANWKDIYPPASLKQIGDDFLKQQEFLLLKLPSAVVPDEYNYMLNPLHKEMSKVKITKLAPFNFDERLINN